MANTAFNIRVDASAVAQLFQGAPEALQTGVRQLVERSAIEVQREMMIAANVGVTGDLRRSVRYTVTAGLLRAEIAPKVPYAEDVEYGTHPHWVSVKEGTPLALWARLKGINKYALQHSIAVKGTRAHPFVRPTYDRMAPKVVRDISVGMASLLRGMSRG